MGTTIIGVVFTMAVGAVLTMVLVDHMKKWKRLISSSSKPPKLKLPAGSVGWPLVGEGLSFLKPHQVGNPGDFLERHISRFGKTFTTNLFGKLTIVTVDADLSRLISQNDIEMFDHGIPNYIKRLVPNSLVFASTEEHKQQRSFILNFLRTEKLRTSIFADLQHAAKTFIAWEDNAVISLLDEVNKFTFSTVAKQTLGLVNGDLRMNELRELYDSIVGGFTTSFPLNLPGTTYNKSLHARTQILNILEQEIRKRMKSKLEEKKEEEEEEEEEEDILEWLINNSEYSLEKTSVFLYGLILGGYITAPAVLALAIYLLGRSPNAIAQLREEHQDIIQSQRKQGDDILTWEHYKRMEFTHCVLNETLRLMGGSYLSRVANRDIEFKGYMIPRGCKILSAARRVNCYDPCIYKNPKSFNPWRWLGPSSIELASKGHFKPFGYGPRQCPGEKLATLEIAIFLHHFILNYNWKPTNSNLIPTMTAQGSVLFPAGGLQIKLETTLRIDTYIAREL